MWKFVVLGTAHPHVFGVAQCVGQAQGAELAGVFDEDPDRLSQAADRLGAKPLRTLKEALALGPAVVLIGAEPAQRAFLAQRAVEAGAAALVDKPLALTRQTLDPLRAAVERWGKPIITYYPSRGSGPLLAAKAVLDSGRLGRMVRVFSAGPHKLHAAQRPAWHWTLAGNGGAWLDIGSHHLDICCWIAGQSPCWLSALHGNFSQPDHPEFQDFAQCQMRFPGGALGHAEVDWLHAQATRHFGDGRMWIQGTLGKVEVRSGDETSVRLWDATAAGEAVDFSHFPSTDEWTAQLAQDLALGRPTAFAQTEVWRASEVTLHAFDSAQAGGRPIELPVGR